MVSSPTWHILIQISSGFQLVLHNSIFVVALCDPLDVEIEKSIPNGNWQPSNGLLCFPLPLFVPVERTTSLLTWFFSSRESTWNN